jgi:O-antigen/teichoic acid export membrane protein
MMLGRARGRLGKLSRFYNNLFLLAGGSVAGQLILLAAAPILTRLYTPRDLGIAGVYVSILGFMSVGCMLRYEMAVAASRDSREAASVTVLACTLALGSALLAAVLKGLAVPLLLVHIRSDVRLIVPYLYWVPIGMATTSIYLAFSMWAVRFEEFRALSATKVTQAIWGVLIQLGTPFLHRGPLGLLAGQVAGQSGGATGLISRAWTADKEHFQRVRFADLKASARKFVRFPAMSLPAVLLESLFLNAPLVVLTSLYGATLAGWVTLANRVFFLPGLLLTRNIAQVVMGEMAQVAAADNLRELEHLFWKRLKQLSLLGVGACLVAGVVAPVLIPRVFGKQWTNAWVCAELLMPALLGNLVSSVFGSALDVLQRQDLHIIREIGRTIILAISMGALYIGRPGWIGALAIVGSMSGVAYLWYLWISWWAIHRQPLRVEHRQQAALESEAPAR